MLNLHLFALYFFEFYKFVNIVLITYEFIDNERINVFVFKKKISYVIIYVM